MHRGHPTEAAHTRRRAPKCDQRSHEAAARSPPDGVPGSAAAVRARELSPPTHRAPAAEAAATGENSCSVRRVLLLRRIQRDVERLLFLADIEGVAERLVPFGDNLDANLALRNGRDAGLAILVGAQFEGGPDGLAKLDDGVSLNEADHDARAV